MRTGEEISYEGHRYLVLSQGETVHDIDAAGRPIIGHITHLLPLDGGKRRMILDIDKELVS